MDERFARAGDIELCYESFGDPSDPTVLLVMGLGTQMIAWHEDFCGLLVDRGYRVVRFDNRDCGRSTHLSHVRPPTPLQLVRRDKRAAAYRLSDMADDTAGLLDALDVDAAHVVGASMGGMIAQTLAARHPDRVRSLASIMASTGSRFAGNPALGVYPIFLRRPPRDREAFIARTVETFGLVGSPGFTRDEDELRRIAGLAFDRGHEAAGTGRQLAAILASGNRTRELRSIQAPTVVIHGSRDRLVSPSGGRATAAAIRGARLVMIDGMGHDLPRGAWDQIVEAIVSNARRAGDASDSGAQAA